MMKRKHLYTRQPYGKRILLIVFLLLFAVNSKAAHESTKILFIGSSYFGYNDLPSLFKNLAEDGGHSVYIDQRIPGGLYLADHAASSVTAAKIKEQQWDYVIVQGVGRLMAYPEVYDENPVYPALETLSEKIHANCATTKIIFCLPWAYEDGMTWLQGWSDTYADMQQKIYKNTLNYANKLDLIIAPVGWAWLTVLEEKNYPLHYLHKSDWNHPSLKGSYLMACVIYSTIYQTGTTNTTYYSDLPKEEATYFQTIASNTVLNNPQLWNITAIKTRENNNDSPTLFNLEQNYPNPFNGTTAINFELPAEQTVSLNIYDCVGRHVETLLNHKIMCGDNTVYWHAANNSSGVYFYELNTGTSRGIKSMQLLK